jgi:thiol-disulfide isomerase/thioredoxin
MEAAAERFLNLIEHSAESPEDYAWFAAFRRRHDIIKGGDNASVRAREALADLAELVRTDLDFTLPDLDGRDVRIQPAPGTSTLVSFWATWCAPCVEELPLLARVARERNVRIVAVTDEPADRVLAFLARHPVSIPILLDSSQTLFARYHVDVRPSLLLFDGSGRLRVRATRVTEAELTPLLGR